MASLERPTVNHLLGRVRWTARAEEDRLRKRIDAIAGKVGVDGLIGNAAVSLFSAIHECADKVLETSLDDFARAIRLSGANPRELVSSALSPVRDHFAMAKTLMDQGLSRIEHAERFELQREDARARLDEMLSFKIEQFLVGMDGRLSDDRARVPVPASNRYVSLQDNQQAAIVEALHIIQAAVKDDNEIDPEDREEILYEIAAFEATIVQPRVAIDLIERFVAKVTKWVADVILKAAVNEAAKNLIRLLASLS